MRRLIALVVLLCACAPAAPGVHRSAITGQDGPKTIADTEIVNLYFPLTDPANPADTTLTVASTTGLGTGDLLLLIAPQGASIATTNDTGYGAISAYGSAGLQEFWNVASVTATTVTLDTSCLPGLVNAYPLAAHPQIVRVPQYTDLTVQAGGVLTGASWDGTQGGVVAVHVERSAQIDGSIDASALGFRGGALSLGATAIGTSVTSYFDSLGDGGEKGESIAGNTSTYDALGGRYGRGAPANGGGGGDGYLAGGGGGAGGGATSTLAYSGEGTMGGGAAWALDPNFSSSGGPGGGRGGYTVSAFDEDATTVAPGDPSWGGNLRQEAGGLGGHPAQSASRLFFGGGGGAGQLDASSLPANITGASGGGLVYLMADTLLGAGAIHADGAAGLDGTLVGTNDGTTIANGGGAGGGGGGGTVVLRASGTPSISVTAVGGAGGNLSLSGTFAAGVSAATGPGGGGAGGVVETYAGLTLGTAPLITGALGGTTSAPALSEFPANGASAGDGGATLGSIPQSTAPVACLPADLSVTLSDSVDPVDVGGAYSYTVTITNGGPNEAYDLTATLTLPTGVVAGTLMATGWTCTQPAQVLTCTRALLTSGVSSNIVLAVTAPTSPGIINATATIASREDPSAANNTDTESTTVLQPAADLVTLMNGPSFSASGESYSYAITISNNGPSDAPAVSVVDVLPSGVSFVSAGGVGWSCANVSGTVTCNYGDLASGNNAKIAIVVAAAALTTPTMVSNTATASITAGVTVDPNSANNSATVSTTIEPVDLSITKTDAVDPVIAGSSITYTITVTNPSNADAHAVAVQDPLPAGTSLVSAAGSGWTCTNPSGTVGCTIPAVAANSASAITLVVTAPATQGMVSNTATVSSSATDTNLANNSATQATTISPPAPGSADLSIALADAPDPVAIGMPLTYTMTVANAGPDPATGVEAVVTLPAGVTFVSASGIGWTCTQVTTTISCALAGSLSGTAAAVSLTVGAPSTQGSIEVEGVVTGTTSDPSFANNTAVADTEVFDPALQNHPPTLSLPTGLTTPENTALVLDSSSAPSIADPDAASDAVQLTVTSTSCVLSLSTTSGLTIVTGDGVLDPLLVARGSIAQLNAALVGATITPVPSFSGQAQLNMVVNDLGHNGAGGPMSVSGTLLVKVAFVDMPPTANNDTVSVSANSTDTAIDVLANDEPGNVGQKLTVVTVSQAQHGSASLSSDGSIILYTPGFDYVGPDQVTYSITDGTYTASAQVAITVVGNAQTNGIGLRGGGLGCTYAGRAPDGQAGLALCALLLLAWARRHRPARRAA
jgi:uncharacterized repeat protein (TIGR01451 family)